MDPPSPIRRDLSTEQILEDMINDGADVDPAESTSTYLNPSGEGARVDNSDGEADGGSDGEADGSSDGESDNSDDGEAGGPLTKSGEVYIYEVLCI